MMRYFYAGMAFGFIVSSVSTKEPLWLIVGLIFVVLTYADMICKQLKEK